MSEWLITSLFIGLYLLIVMRNAWVSDDAFITFRVIDNFVNGHGLVWNIMERVEVFTHPLWLFFLSVFYFFSGEFFYTTIFVSILCSFLAVWLLVFRIAISLSQALLSLMILMSSNAFVDYSTSGLENPLTYLLIAIFATIYFTQGLKLKTIFGLFAIANLGILNRMDVVLLFLPALVYILVKFHSRQVLYIVFVASLPFIVWKLFSLFYYGFPFPNTAYAKLNTGLDDIDLIKQGLLYILYSIQMDPLTIFILITSILIPFLAKEWSQVPFILGIVLYLLYVINIGGDFMAGRFFAAPLFFAVIVISRQVIANKVSVLFFIVVVFVSVLNGNSPIFLNVEMSENKNHLISNAGIADEQLFYFSSRGLLSANRLNRIYYQGDFIGARVPDQIALCGGLGITGLNAGHKVDILDDCALTDPLMARLPIRHNPDWRIGHYLRLIPEGYAETRSSGRNQIQDKDLALYYDKLAFITQGELFNTSRLLEILYMNLGKYDHLIDVHFYRYPDMVKIKLSEMTDMSGVPISAQGIQIDVEKVSHAPYLLLGLSSDYLKIIYIQGNKELDTQIISSPSINLGSDSFTVAKTPDPVVQQGYNKVMIIPLFNQEYKFNYLKLLSVEKASLIDLIQLYYFAYYRPDIFKDQKLLDAIIARMIKFPEYSWSTVSYTVWMDLQYIKTPYINSLAHLYLEKNNPKNVNKILKTSHGDTLEVIGYTVEYHAEHKGFGLTFYLRPQQRYRLHNYQFVLQLHGVNPIKLPLNYITRLWIPNKIYKVEQIVCPFARYMRSEINKCGLPKRRKYGYLKGWILKR